MKKILVTGGNGRFANELKKNQNKYFRFTYLKVKKQLNICNYNSIIKTIKKHRPTYNITSSRAFEAYEIFMKKK